MKASEIREMSEQEIKEKINEFEEELFNLRFQVKTGQAANPVRMRIVKREIARLKTVLNEKRKGINV